VFEHFHSVRRNRGKKESHKDVKKMIFRSDMDVNEYDTMVSLKNRYKLLLISKFGGL